MSENILSDLPTYIKGAPFEQQEPYFELMSLILVRWFGSSGFYNCNLTNNEVEDLLFLQPQPPPGTRWLNTTINKEQFIGTDGAVHTITST